MLGLNSLETKIKNKTLSLLPGTITCYHHVSSDSIGIFDGQHRVAALFLLSQRGLWPSDAKNILVECFPVEDCTHEVMALFREINSAEPVSVMDMLDGEMIPDEADTELSCGSLSVQEKKLIIDEACAQLQRESPSAMFKPSKACKPPHVNIDSLRETVFESELFSDTKSSINTAEELLKHIYRINEELGKRSDEEWINKKYGRTAIKPAALAKARKHNFYLGLDRWWITMNVNRS